MKKYVIVGHIFKIRRSKMRQQRANGRVISRRYMKQGPAKSQSFAAKTLERECFHEQHFN